MKKLALGLMAVVLLGAGCSQSPTDTTKKEARIMPIQSTSVYEEGTREHKTGDGTKENRTYDYTLYRGELELTTDFYVSALDGGIYIEPSDKDRAKLPLRAKTLLSGENLKEDLGLPIDELEPTGRATIILGDVTHIEDQEFVTVELRKVKEVLK